MEYCCIYYNYERSVHCKQQQPSNQFLMDKIKSGHT